MNLRAFTPLTMILLLALAPAQSASSRECELDRAVVLAGLNWGSNQFHVAVVSRVLRDGYGCRVTSNPGTTKPLQRALLAGKVDVMMEVWGDGLNEPWQEGLELGQVVDIGVNFPDSKQGWYVPRYLVEGPNAKAPDLKSVSDLPRYKHLFEDPNQPGKGRFYNCIKGWLCEGINSKKFRLYGLEKFYTNVRPKSSAALAAAIVRASRLAKPVLAYYWEPTWMVGAYDLVMLDEPRFNGAAWRDLTRNPNPTEAVAYPTLAVRKAVNGNFKRSAPIVTKFLSKYRTNSELISEALAYVQEVEGATPDDAAEHFLETHERVWSSWVPDDVAEQVKAKL